MAGRASGRPSMTTNSAARLSNRELLDAMVRTARDERQTTAELLTLLAEVDARRLYLSEGCSSLFTYCTRVLHFSEHAAYHRIEAARAARRFPVILEHVVAGEVTLTTAAMLRPHLTENNHRALLEAARHKTKKEVEYQLACLAPRPAASTMIRRLPDTKSSSATHPVRDEAIAMGATPHLPGPPAGTGLVPAATTTDEPARGQVVDSRPKVTALASDRYLLRVTLSTDAHKTLRRAQDLMRHTIPNGDAAVIVERALTLLVDHLEKAKLGKPRRAAASRRHQAQSQRRPDRTRSSRHIPTDVRRAVWARDQGRCAFIGSRGRCAETGGLEFHHLVPFARGGRAAVSNIALRCRAHNQYEGDLVFGPGQRRKAATRSGPS